MVRPEELYVRWTFNLNVSYKNMKHSINIFLSCSKYGVYTHTYAKAPFIHLLVLLWTCWSLVRFKVILTFQCEEPHTWKVNTIYFESCVGMLRLQQAKKPKKKTDSCICWGLIRHADVQNTTGNALTFNPFKLFQLISLLAKGCCTTASLDMGGIWMKSDDFYFERKLTVHIF